MGKDKLNSILRLVVKLYQCGSREKIILLLIIKVFIIMSNNLQKENLEIEKNIITVDELSDEYIDKKKQLEEAYSKIIIQYIDAIKIAKSICGLF